MKKKRANLTPNFYRLILSSASRNIADSFYLIALSLGLVQVYQVDAASLSLFTLVGMLPRLFAAAYGPYLQAIRRNRLAILSLQLVQLAIMAGILLCLLQAWPLPWMVSLNFLFSFVTVCLNNLQMKVIPSVLDNNDELLNKSVDIQYLAGNVLDITSNFVASVLLGFISYLVLMQLSLPFFIAALYFLFRLRIPDSRGDEMEEDVEGVKIDRAASFKALSESKDSFYIVLTEAVLSGGTDLLLTLTPIYLISQGYSVAYLGLVLGLQRGADLLGAILAPYVKMDPRVFFPLDYILSGLSFVLVFLIPIPQFKLFFLFLGFVIIGISGNMFNKLIYASYNHDELSLVNSAIVTLYTFFAILSLLIPSVYDNIQMLGLVINGATILVGIWLFSKISNFVSK
ncbi:MFS transporter [Streptococcus sp. NLN76]|uniref:MFS transporter n=1 Tax=Streptococcus sp. NLN76 TaxID=2822800 RepID=UPI0018A915F6|nr:MFS transporter [Streptococcus sp. NLN76]MBF8970740.1 MFS transporter [Streptococcus sp. NLN76]